METLLYYATETGFITLTTIFYLFVMMTLKKALAKTGWDGARIKRIFSKVLYSLIGWTIFISVLSLSGFLSDFSAFPPRLMIVLIIPLCVIIYITFSKTMKELLPHIPARTIVNLQVFRVFVEILLWSLFIQNILPVQMSFEGRNFDVLSGLTAPFAAYFLVNNKTALFIWNIFGLALLVNILTIAILSLPNTPFRVFMNEPANTIVTYFPFVLLPGLLVPLAYGLHFFSLRKLVTEGELHAEGRIQNAEQRI